MEKDKKVEWYEMDSFILSSLLLAHLYSSTKHSTEVHRIWEICTVRSQSVFIVILYIQSNLLVLEWMINLFTHGGYIEDTRGSQAGWKGSEGKLGKRRVLLASVSHMLFNITFRIWRIYYSMK